VEKPGMIWCKQPKPMQGCQEKKQYNKMMTTTAAQTRYLISSAATQSIIK
jgi:hypothetical protein